MTIKNLAGAVVAAFAASLLTSTAALLWYETWALATGKSATVSAVVGDAIGNHPHWAVAVTAILFLTLGALSAHFAHWT